ncbi:hypothetical protein OGAPHI_000693 [Ogataea philodendri]|uniref:t-SNARE coiled-coil homology domain-containing protein n=1 Tax=Ogataea philodendri TaxID=1378263 RepID=A0A9P8PFA9_9ASCO|nr:uncharacterized protein OGAPHI_000693 [Ogataea philodendri]KAH3670982.1 hypothetical protein OGAPHI_000693 [Ogataea philodendri]
MFDHTPFFHKCVSIYQQELKLAARPAEKTSGASRHRLGGGNTFLQDSVKLNTMISQLGSFISEIQTDYLLSHSKKLSESDKDQIDTNFKLQLGVLNKKLEGLRAYGELLDKQLTSSSSVEELGKNLLTMGEYGQNSTIANNTVIEIRANIVKSLGLRLTKISSHFIAINNKRMNRKKELNKSSINTSTYLQRTVYNSVDHDAVEKTVSPEYSELASNLDQQQLQQLSQENESILLELKSAQLESVNQIEQSMLEISSVINEINLQLHLQNDSISVLSSHQDDTVANLKMGNTQLVKANERAKRSGQNLSYLIVVLAYVTSGSSRSSSSTTTTARLLELRCRRFLALPSLLMIDSISLSRDGTEIPFLNSTNGVPTSSGLSMLNSRTSHLNFLTGCNTLLDSVATSPTLMFSVDASFLSLSSTNSPACAIFCRLCFVADDPTFDVVIEIESTTATSWLGEILTLWPGWITPEFTRPLTSSSSVLDESWMSLITMMNGELLSTGWLISRFSCSKTPISVGPLYHGRFLLLETTLSPKNPLLGKKIKLSRSNSSSSTKNCSIWVQIES